MPTFNIPDGEIYYEVHGSGFPLMIFAPGGLRSELDFWRRSPANPLASAVWMDPMAVLGTKYQVVAMDQRNAGRSRTRIFASDDWHIYAADHLALANHLALDRFHVMGGCIGASFCLTLCELAPSRITSAVLQNPIGHAGNREVFAGLVRTWAKDIREQRPEVGEHVLKNFGDNMFGGDFVFSVSREFVRQCKTPLLVLPGDDPPHPQVIGEEIIELAPNVEALRQWKGPEHLQTAIERVSAFLDRHTPR
ncbi:MAG: alpha/beta hydrolase [Alphaproteobacteria bacterium]|nr:alpha/beta hydrolase [Alphaproteobacteria bacterium]